MADFPYQVWGEFIISKIDVNKPTIELACGTGNLTIELFKRGVNIEGSDIDENMLVIAKEKATNQELDLDFFLYDMVNADLSGYENIICPCDGVNSILTENELKSFFENVAKNLKGKFIFDFSTQKKLKSLDGQIYYEDYEDVTYFWDSEYNFENDEANLYLTFFEKLKNGYYNREDVSIIQKGLNISLVKRIVEESGLIIQGVYDDYSPLPANEDSNRVVFVCIKQN